MGATALRGAAEAAPQVGSALFQFNGTKLAQLPNFDLDAAPFAQKFAFSTQKQLLIACVDDQQARFYQLSGQIVKTVHFRQQFGFPVIYCCTSPDATVLAFLGPDNQIALLQDFEVSLLHPQIEEIPQSLIKIAVNNDKTLALLFEHVPYAVIYQNDSTAIQDYQGKMLEIPPDVDFYYLLRGDIPTNNVRPALLSATRDGRFLACAFSPSSC